MPCTGRAVGMTSCKTCFALHLPRTCIMCTSALKLATPCGLPGPALSPPAPRPSTMRARWPPAAAPAPSLTAGPSRPAAGCACCRATAGDRPARWVGVGRRCLGCRASAWPLERPWEVAQPPSAVCRHAQRLRRTCQPDACARISSAVMIWRSDAARQEGVGGRVNVTVGGQQIAATAVRRCHHRRQTKR